MEEKIKQQDCGIYKITNLINGKIYIGQSIHIEQRWKEHCRQSAKSLISDAIKKYGKENFSFEIIERCSQEKLNERETYYIQLFNCITPNGYNIIENNNSIYTSYIFISKDNILKIIDDIKNTDLSFKEIGEKYNISTRAIYYINKGDVHYFDNEQYPLREVKDYSQKNFCIDCGKPILRNSVRCADCDRKYRRSFCPVTREELKQLIRTTPFTEIGIKFGYSDNGIRKWCTWFNLPHTKKEINSYSDEEWKNI